MGKCVQMFTAYVPAYPEATSAGCPCKALAAGAAGGLCEGSPGAAQGRFQPGPAGSAAAPAQGTAEAPLRRRV